jgi:hypothetical protein
MSPRRYSLSLLFLVLLLLTLVGVFNRIVDPFWYFRDIEVRGFNLDKPRFPRNERLVKSALVRKIRPQAIILGNSFAEVGFPAKHAGFTDSDKLAPYNLGLSGAKWPEIYCYALFALAQPGVRRVILPLSGMTENSCAGFRNLGDIDHAGLLLSKNALSASWDTLRKQDGVPLVTREGMWYMQRYEAKIRNDTDITINFANLMRDSFCRSPRPARVLDPRRIDRSTPVDDGATAGLRKLVRLAIEKNIHLILMPYPKHVLHYEAERRCEGIEARWSELWKIAAVVEQETSGGAGSVEVWDFHGYRETNAERVHAGKAMRERWWQDNGHFNHEVGAAAFNSIFSARRGYGHRIDTGDFDSLVASIERERSDFLARNPWVEPELYELARLVGAGW